MWSHFIKVFVDLHSRWMPLNLTRPCHNMLTHYYQELHICVVDIERNPIIFLIMNSGNSVPSHFFFKYLVNQNYPPHSLQKFTILGDKIILITVCDLCVIYPASTSNTLRVFFCNGLVYNGLTSSLVKNNGLLRLRWVS